MEANEIDCSFGFILKRFHMMLRLDHIKLPEYDILLLDEAGDVNACSLDIFMSIPATKKVMVGDKYQNLYSFNHTIDGFSHTRQHGIELPLTRSFRVSEPIANAVELFCKRYISSSMSFKGVPTKDTTIKSLAYLSRTNATLVARMVKLHETSTPYTLLRPLMSIFALPLALANLTNRSWKRNDEFAHIYAIYDEYCELPPETRKAMSHMKYLADHFELDIQVQTAISLVVSNTPKKIIDTYYTAKELNRPNQFVTLSTAFTAKGSEWDQIYIEEDLNNSIINAIDSEDYNDEVRTLLFLGYVAATRARKQLDNAKFLTYKPFTTKD